MQNEPPRKVVVHSSRKRKGDEESGEGVPKKWRSASASAEKMISASASAEKMIEDDVLVTAYAIPVSDISNRVLLGQLGLNQTFPKTYANPNPVTKPPVQHMSISSAFHAASSRRAKVREPKRGVGEAKRCPKNMRNARTQQHAHAPTGNRAVKNFNLKKGCQD